MLPRRKAFRGAPSLASIRFKVGVPQHGVIAAAKRENSSLSLLPLSSPPLFSLSLLCLACGRGGGSGEDLVEIGKCARAGILVLKHGGAAVKDVDAALLKALAELGRNPHFPAGRAGGVASRG